MGANPENQTLSEVMFAANTSKFSGNPWGSHKSLLNPPRLNG